MGSAHREVQAVTTTHHHRVIDIEPIDWFQIDQEEGAELLSFEIVTVEVERIIPIWEKEKEGDSDEDGGIAVQDYRRDTPTLEQWADGRSAESDGEEVESGHLEAEQDGHRLRGDGPAGVVRFPLRGE